MGHRSNYAIVENGKLDLRYSHWGANTLPRDLFWGPPWALSFIRRQEPTNEWLDTRWCEGAALVEVDAKRLLLFGGEDIASDVVLRRAYLELVGSVWAGWSIRWAFEELVDIADCLGISRSGVLSDHDHFQKPLSAQPQRAGEWSESLASVRWEDGSVGVYPMECDADVLLRCGPALVELLRGFGAPPTELTTVPSEECRGGVHLVPSSKKIDFWLAHTEPDAQARVSRCWPGWAVTWHLDRFERHLDLAERRFDLAQPSPQKLLEQLHEILTPPAERHRGADARSAAKLLAREGYDVQIDARALVDAPQMVSGEERERILKIAVAAYLERR